MIAKMLLESAGGYSSASNYNFSKEAHIGSDYLASALVEMTESLCQCDIQYMVADVVGSVKVMTEGADIDVVTEGIIRDGFEKLKSIWKKLIAKIKEYYKKVVEFFKAMTLTGAKFVNQFGTKLKDKAKNTNFTYTGYEYNTNKGDAMVNRTADMMTKEYEKLIGKLTDTAVDKVTGADLIAMVKNTNADTSASSSDYVEAILNKTFSVSSVADLAESIKEEYRGGESKIDGLAMDGSKCSEMCDLIKDSKKTISTIENDRTRLIRICESVIRNLDKAGSGKSESDGEEYKKASTISTYLSALVNVIRTAYTQKVDIYREMTKNYTAVLKALYRYKEAKEEFDPSMDVEMEEGCDQTADEDLKDMEEALQIYLEGDCNEDDDDRDDDDDVEESFFAQAARYL